MKDPRLRPSAARLALGFLAAPLAVPLLHAAIVAGVRWRPGPPATS